MSRIWVPKFKIIEAQFPAQIMRVKGLYQLRAVKRDGVTVDRKTDWFENLILDQGLDLLASGTSNLHRAHVGTGTTAPNVADTALETPLANTDTGQSASRATNSSSPYEMTSTVVKRFAQGAAEGNLTEVGIGTNGGTLFSRALIVDGLGSPTTFPVAADEYLDVAYQLIMYPPLGDSTGTITITGVGSRDYTSRAAGLPASWYPLNGGTVGMFLDTGGGGSFSGQAYTGALGAITSAPSGNIGNADGASNDSYSAGTFTRTGTMSWGLDSANGNILSIVTNWGANTPVSTLDRTNMAFQHQYSSAIVKNATQLLSLGFRITWARA